MKFLLIVLTAHLFGAVINDKRKRKQNRDTDEADKHVPHPAEFNVR